VLVSTNRCLKYVILLYPIYIQHDMNVYSCIVDELITIPLQFKIWNLYSKHTDTIKIQNFGPPFEAHRFHYNSKFGTSIRSIQIPLQFKILNLHSKHTDSITIQNFEPPFEAHRFYYNSKFEASIRSTQNLSQNFIGPKY